MSTQPNSPPDGARTVLLTKDGMLGIFGLAEVGDKIRVASNEPRLDVPSVHEFETLTAAEAVFDDRLRATRRNGWQVFYDGPPLLG